MNSLPPKKRRRAATAPASGAAAAAAVPQLSAQARAPKMVVSHIPRGARAQAPAHPRRAAECPRVDFSALRARASSGALIGSEMRGLRAGLVELGPRRSDRTQVTGRVRAYVARLLRRAGSGGTRGGDARFVLPDAREAVDGRGLGAVALARCRARAARRASWERAARAVARCEADETDSEAEAEALSWGRPGDDPLCAQRLAAARAGVARRGPAQDPRRGRAGPRAARG